MAMNGIIESVVVIIVQDVIKMKNGMVLAADVYKVSFILMENVANVQQEQYLMESNVIEVILILYVVILILIITDILAFVFLVIGNLQVVV
jgi:subtilase family serine protease